MSDDLSAKGVYAHGFQDRAGTLTTDEKDGALHVEGGSAVEVATVDVEDIGRAHDFELAAQLATQREHELTFRQALRLYPSSFFWAIAISFTILMEGYDTYLLGNFYAYPSFARKYGDYHSDSNTWIIAPKWQVTLSDVGIVGNVIGLLGMGICTDRFGHRKVIIGGLILLSACHFITFFAPNIKVLTVAIALSGVPYGLFGIMGSAYASEVCPLALRGFLTSFVNICWVIGQLVAAGVLTGLVSNTTEWSYRIPFALQWAFIPPLLILAYMAPESPWWCVHKSRLRDAEISLQRLSSGSSPLQTRQTLAMMVHTDKLEKAMNTEASYWDCFKGTNLRRTEIACMVLAAQALAGETFAYGSTYFFTQAGFSSSNAYKLNFGASAVSFVGTVGSWTLMIWFGRRPIIIWGFVAMTTLLFLTGVLSYAKTQAAIWTQAAFTILWLGTYSLTLGPQSFGLAAEVSATRLRAQTVSLARLFYQLAGLITNTVEPYLINPTAANLKGKTAFVWMGTSILTLVWCVLRMPETKGLTYTELDILFEKRTPAWRFKTSKVDVVEATHQIEEHTL